MKRPVITLIKIFISILLIWFLIHTSKLDIGILPQLFNKPFILACTILIGFSTLLFSSRRWYLLNKTQGIPISFKRTLLPAYLGIAFNNLLPGGVGGDFYRCFYLFKRIPDNKSMIMLSILFDRITGLMGIFIAISFISFFYLETLHQQQIPLSLILIPVSICISALFVFFLSLILPPQPGLGPYLQKSFPQRKWLQPLLSLLDALRMYRSAKWIILKCLIYSLFVQLIIAITCMLIAHMLNFPAISFFAIILAIGLAQIANLIPIAPGGIGVGEVAFANILLLMNPDAAASYATIFLVYRIINILPYLPGVIIFSFQPTNSPDILHDQQL